MVAIVSGNSLGLNLSSLAVLGQHGRGPAAPPGADAWVNVANGNLVLQSQDELLVGRGADAATLRTYNSQGLLDDADNGDNWSNGTWLRPLVPTGTRGAADSTLHRTDADGSVAVYTWDSARALYRSTDGAGAHDTITYLAAEDQYEWQEGTSGVRQRYQGSGAMRLLSTRDEAGNVLAYGYDAAGRLASATSANGESTHYDYVGNQLEKVRTVTAGGVTSTRVRYAYDASNRLATVTVDLTPGDNAVADGAVHQTRYTYDADTRRVASVVRGDGTSLAFTYVLHNGAYRIASVTDGLGRVTSFTYGTGLTTVADPLGRVTRYDMDAQGQLVKITSPLGTTQSFAYDAAGNVLSVDASGRITTRTYDDRGNETSARDPLFNTISRTFDAANRLLTETSSGAEPVTTRYVYGPDTVGRRGALAFVVSAAGRVTEHRYDSFGFGQRIATLEHLGGRYPVSGLASNVAPTLADLQAWVAGRGATSARLTEFTYDPRGQLATTTTFARLDAAGQGIRDGTESVTRYVRDSAGRLLQAIDPTNGTTTHTYDGLGRVLTSTDAAGQVTVTQYQDASRRTVTTLASGAVSTRVHDAAGRLVSEARSSTAGTLGETKYWYDAAGQLRMTQDPTGVRQWMVYDSDGRKAGDIDANGTLTEYRYDWEGRLRATLRFPSAINLANLVDAAGEPVLTATLSSLGRVITLGEAGEFRSYDQAGRLTREARTTLTGVVSVTEHTYDGAARLIRSVQYANTSSMVGAINGSIWLPATSVADRVTRYFHDADGLQVGRLDAEGYLTRYRHDDAGRLVEQTAYATATDAALRSTGTLEQLTPATSAADQRQLRWHDGHGRLVAELDAEGFLTEHVFDAAGRLTLTVRYANRTGGTATTTATPRRCARPVLRWTAPPGAAMTPSAGWPKKPATTASPPATPTTRAGASSPRCGPSGPRNVAMSSPATTRTGAWWANSRARAPRGWCRASRRSRSMRSGPPT
ncbi:MAG TPA: hypothetical protein VEA40_17775, partial [Ramlibacter sp.]|nr:hypothetical protein [Ramlibacter sp.]